MHAQGELLGISGQGGLTTCDPGAALLELGQGLGAEFLGGVKQGGLRFLWRGRGQVQGETAFLRDAFLAAHQPLGLQAKGQWPTVREAEFGRHRHRHGQQQTAFVAIVGQGADGDFFGQRPSDVTGLQAGGQLPLQPGGQARVAGVLPIGVPMGLVFDQQAQPKSFPCLNALGGVHQQFGPHLLGVDHIGRACQQGLGGRHVGGRVFVAKKRVRLCPAGQGPRRQ